jgi:outer membrane protein assembly factor BamB
MMRRSLITALTALCLTTSLATAADWPHFFGPTRNGIAPDTGLNKDWQANPPQVVWRAQMGDNGYAGPCVADGKVFIIDRDGDNDVVKCLGLQDGAEVWRCPYQEGGKDNYGFARSTPSYADGKLYTLSRFGILCCLDATSGKIVWSKALMRDFGGKPPQWNYAASPLVDGDQVIVQCGSPQGNVIAFNKDSGDVAWVGDNGDTAGYATPTIATILGQRQYVMATGKSVIGVHPDTGKTLWGFTWTTKYDVNASQPIVQGNFVFITSGYGSGCGLVEITAEGPKPRWDNKEISAHFSSPIYFNDYIYSNSDAGGGSLVCMSPQQGQVAWKQGGFEKGGLLIADGVIIACAGNTGDVIMAAADPAGYKELGRIKPLGGQSWTAPILSDGLLLVRNKQALVCISLK